MIAIYRKFFSFSGKQKKNFNLTIMYSVVHSFFEALRIPAIAVVLKALINNYVSYNTLYYLRR